MIHEGCFCGNIRIETVHLPPGVELETVQVRCSHCPEDPEPGFEDLHQSSGYQRLKHILDQIRYREEGQDL